MIDLIGRAVAVLRNEGVGGLFRSTGAYLYNQLQLITSGLSESVCLEKVCNQHKQTTR